MDNSWIEHERFSRMRRMVGDEGMGKLAGASVVVVGLGAVGSYVTEALTRSGVGRLRLVDFDVISASNINRQLLALESTLGLPKSNLARQRALDINPHCRVEALHLFAHHDTMDQVLAGPPNLVIDAIDAVNPKVTLLEAVLRREIPVLSSMGAALRTDPSAIHVTKLSKTKHCPLARRVRRMLRRREVSPKLVQCVYSEESLQHLRPDALADLDECPTLCRGRKRRSMGSLPTITGIFGLTLAHAALDFLLEGNWGKTA